MATTTTNSPSRQLAASHNKMPTCVCVCVSTVCCVCLCRVFLCAPMHARPSIFLSGCNGMVHVCVCLHVVCHSSPSHLSTCCSCALFVDVHTFAHILLHLLPFFFISLSVFASSSPHHSSQGKNHPGNSFPSGLLLLLSPPP